MFGLTDNEKLLKAAKRGDLKAVKHWIESQQTDVNAQHYGGLTPLYLAACEYHKDVVDYLLLNKETLKPALDVAMKKNNVPALKFLIETSGYPVKTDFNYNQRDIACTEPTLLLEAAEYGHVEVCEYLLEAGADIKACVLRPDNAWINSYNKSGNYGVTRYPTAIDIAFHAKNEKLVNFLENYSPTEHRAQKEKSTEERVSKMTAQELERALTYDEELLQFLLVTQQLVKHLEKFPYKESKSVYTKIRPKVDDKNREAIETMIRNKRQGAK